MQEHASSLVSKHKPSSVSQLQARSGWLARSKPGLQSPSSCDGKPSEGPDFEPPPAEETGAESPPPAPLPDLGSSTRPPQARSPLNTAHRTTRFMLLRNSSK